MPLRIMMKNGVISCPKCREWMETCRSIIDIEKLDESKIPPIPWHTREEWDEFHGGKINNDFMTKKEYDRR